MPPNNSHAALTPAQGRYGKPGMGLIFPTYYRPALGVKCGTTLFPLAENWLDGMRSDRCQSSRR